MVLCIWQVTLHVLQSGAMPCVKTAWWLLQEVSRWKDSRVREFDGMLVRLLKAFVSFCHRITTLKASMYACRHNRHAAVHFSALT